MHIIIRYDRREYILEYVLYFASHIFVNNDFFAFTIKLNFFWNISYEDRIFFVDQCYYTMIRWFSAILV